MVQRPSNMILGWQIISVQPCPACSWLLLSSKTWKSSKPLFAQSLRQELSCEIHEKHQETIPPVINHGAMKIIIPRIRVYPISNNMNLLAEEFDPSPFSLKLISPTRNTCSVLDLFINCGGPFMKGIYYLMLSISTDIGIGSPMPPATPHSAWLGDPTWARPGGSATRCNLGFFPLMTDTITLPLLLTLLLYITIQFIIFAVTISVTFF